MFSSVDLIKEKIDIVDLIGSYLTLEKAGPHVKARCPFHNEKTPSFFVSPDRGTYYCFGCGAKGDIFTFVQEFEGLDFRGALKVLAHRAGVSIEPENPTLRTEKERLIAALLSATFFFQKKLSETPQALSYLKGRGLSIETIKEWKIGYAPLDWCQLHDFLIEKGFSKSELHTVGLVKKSEKGNGEYYDVFRGRIMFPIFDSSGTVIAFSGRILVDDEKSPKYLNTPETPLFNKSGTLYGLHKAKVDIRRKDYAILVEGQMDLVMSHQGGWGNTVASSGTAFTIEHIQKLKKLSNRIMMAFDADSAGFAAANKSAQLALSLGMEVKVASLPKGSDPAELIKSHSGVWSSALKNSLHIIDFYTKSLLQKNIDTRSLGKEIERHVLPYIAMIESDIERGHFISNIARDTGIKEDSLWEDLRKEVKKASGVREKNTVVYNPVKRQGVDVQILGIVWWQEGARERYVDPALLRARLIETLGEPEYADLEKMHLEEKSELIFQAEAYYNNNTTLAQEIDTLFLNLESERLKTSFTKAMHDLAEAERKKDTKQIEALLLICQELSKKISALPKGT